MLAEFAERVKYFFDLFCALNFHDDALLASGFELPILETDSLIGVVEAKTFGNGVPERFAGCNKSVIVEIAAAAPDKANDDFHASLALLPLLDALLQWA
jgi:hypothetical protein